MQGDVPKRCTPEIMRSIIRQHLASPAMWCILAIQVPISETSGVLHAVRHAAFYQGHDCR